MIKIALIGAQSVGKDTLCHHLFSYLKKKKKTCYYISEIAEQAIMRRMDLRTIETQMWMLSMQIAEETAAEEWDRRAFMICNRSVFDAGVYAKVLKLEHAEDVMTIAKMHHKIFPYDLIIHLRPFAELELDGIREDNRPYQLAIDKAFTELPLKMIEINDPTKEERALSIEKIADEFLRGMKK